jgi:PAS domain S-box-containing protein
MSARANSISAVAQSAWPRVGSFTYRSTDDSWEWSDAVAMMHGYEPGTVTPTTELVLAHKHPDDKPTVAQLIEQVRRHGVPFSSRHRIIDTRGTVHVVVVVGQCRYDGDGEVVGTTGFYVDVTEEFDADLQHSVDEIVSQLARSRAVINQAIGMLMLVYGVSSERAFDVLAWRSSQSNVKLRTIATQIVAEAATSDMMHPHIRARFDHLLLTADQRIGQEEAR